MGRFQKGNDSMKTRSLLSEARKLPFGERAELAHAILKTLETERRDNEPVSNEIKQELDRRWRAYLRNPSDVYSREEVRKKLNQLSKKKRA